MKIKAAADAHYAAAAEDLAESLQSTVKTIVVEQATIHVATPHGQFDARGALIDLPRSLNWAIDFEPLPLAENRVTPSKTKFDALGIPVPVLYYSVTDYWNAGRDRGLQDLNKIAELLDAEVLSTDVKWQNRQHVMGTTRMGDDAEDSVVDRDCRTHDHPNMFIAGTSVMPSASCMNPTLTGAALSVRIAEQLITEI